MFKLFAVRATLRMLPKTACLRVFVICAKRAPSPIGLLRVCAWATECWASGRRPTVRHDGQ
eukprot:3174752-Alexandrium_andersonii.AAC.1